MSISLIFLLNMNSKEENSNIFQILRLKIS
nr:MAG TPA: hypothetical protein [Caudoviricetes sp.]